MCASISLGWARTGAAANSANNHIRANCILGYSTAHGVAAWRPRTYPGLNAGGLDVETDPLALLQKTDNFEKVVRSRVAGRSEHPHEAFGRDVRGLGEFGKTDGCVDVVAQDGLGRGDIAGEHGFDPLTQKLFAELGIARNAGTDRLFEITGQGHG